MPSCATRLPAGLLLAALLLPAPAGAGPDPATARWLLKPTHSPSGEPVSSPALLQAAQRVRTEAGDLPQLQIAVDGEQLKLPLEHTHVFAELGAYTARVDVVQTYHNPFKEPIEAVYVFPLPENSAVDDMKIKIGERVIEADIQKRDEARKTYEDAKRQGHTAALLEQERPNIFTQSVANIAPGERIEVMIRYVQTLTYDAGEYEFVFPMVVGPRFIPGEVAVGQQGNGWSPDTEVVPDASRITPPILGAGVRSGHDISLEVVLDAGFPVMDLDLPTHEVDAAEQDDGTLHVRLKDHDSIPNRDFVMRYRVDAEAPQVALQAHRTGKEGFFSLVVQPPKLDVDELVGQREIIFVVDVSGSMSGVPLGLAKDAVRLAVRQLRPVDTFNIYTFAGQTARAFATPRPANQANITTGLRFVEQTMAGGGTYLAQAVQEALSPPVEAGRHRYVFFLTDGYVGNEKQIFDAASALVAEQKRRGQRANVFSLGTGSSVNRHLLDGLAKAGQGLAVYATNREDPSRAVNRFFGAIDHAVLRDLKIDWGGLAVQSVQPAELPDLFASRPLVLHGRYARAGSGTVTLRGKAGGQAFVRKIQVTLPERGTKHAALPTLWARAEVEDLSRRLWAGPDKEAVDAITAIGLKHRIVTAYTSFVAVDRSRKVGKGKPKKVVQPVETPEGVDASMAAPSHATVGHGVGGMGLLGTGSGGGGVGYGRVHGMARLGDTGSYGRGAGGEGAMGKRAAAPTVRMAAADGAVHGSMDKSVIQRVIRRHTAQVRHAFEKALKSNPTLKGKLVLRITIGADGKVEAVEATEDTLGVPTLTADILRIVGRWHFPKPAGGGKIVVSWPFVFAPG